MEFDISLIVNSLPLLLKGAGLTLEITALAVGLGLVIGLFLGLAQLSKSAFLRWPAKVYVDIIRGTPLLIQIFIIYFALPNIIGERIDPFLAAVAACSLNSGAYIAEIFRAGIQSIALGQLRAGLSLGMTYPQTMRYVVLPQALRNIMPSVANEFVINIKDTSVLNVIGFTELFFYAKTIVSGNYQIFATYLLVAVIYFILTFTITRVLRLIEKKMDGKKDYSIQGSQNMDAEAFVKEHKTEGGNIDA